MGILEIIKKHLENSINGIDNIYFNFQPDIKGNCIILWQYDGIQTDIGLRPQVQISVKNKSMATAESTIQQIYDIMYPIGTFEKSITVTTNENTTETVKIVPRQSPFYLEKDDNNRHVYVFNIDCIMQRRQHNDSI